MHSYPLLKIKIQWVPGHQGLRGNSRAHELTRESNPGPPLPWPKECEYEPKVERKTLHKARKEILKDRRPLFYPHRHIHIQEKRHPSLEKHKHTLYSPSSIFITSPMLQDTPAAPIAVGTPRTSIHSGTAQQPTKVDMNPSPSYPTTSLQAAGRNGPPPLQNSRSRGGHPSFITFKL